MFDAEKLEASVNKTTSEIVVFAIEKCEVQASDAVFNSFQKRYLQAPKDNDLHLFLWSSVIKICIDGAHQQLKNLRDDLTLAVNMLGKAIEANSKAKKD